MAAVRAKAEATASTYEKLKAASATPGVVAGNDVRRRAKGGRRPVRARSPPRRQNVEAARQALKSVSDMEGYLRVTAPFSGVVTERNVHPGALVGPTGGPRAAMPMVRIVESNRLRLVIPVPEAYTAAVDEWHGVDIHRCRVPGQTFTGTVARIAQAVDVDHANDGCRTGREQHGRPARAGHVLSGKWPVRRTTPSMFVPSGSVATTTDRTFVIRVRGGRRNGWTSRPG